MKITLSVFLALGLATTTTSLRVSSVQRKLAQIEVAQEELAPTPPSEAEAPPTEWEERSDAPEFASEPPSEAEIAPAQWGIRSDAPEFAPEEAEEPPRHLENA